MANDVVINIRGEGAQQTQAHIEGVTGSLKRMGEFAGGFVAVQLGQKLVGAMRDAIGGTIDFSSQLEQAGLAFETMLGSAELAQTTLKQLRDFAKTTPFDFPELLEAAKRLLAYGTAAEDLIPTMTILGNITAGVGKDKLPQLILAFGQVQAATKLTGAELRQFSEAGVPMLELLAKTMGKPVKAIQELVAEGKVGFKEVRDALASTSEEGGKFAGLMDKQSRTFGGAVSNIKDSLRFLIADGFKPFFDKLRDGAVLIAQFLETGEFKAFAATVASAMAHAGEIAGELITTLFNLGRMVAQNQPLVIGLAATLTLALLPALAGAALAIGGVIAAAAPFILTFGAVAAAVAVVIDHWSLFEQAGSILMTVLGQLANFIGEKVGGAFQFLGDVVGKAIGWIMDRLSDLAEVLGPIAEKIGIDLSGISKSAGMMSFDIGAAFSAIPEMAGNVGNAIGGLVEQAKSNLGAGLGAIGEMAQAIVGELGKPIEFAMEQAAAPTIKFTDALQAAGDAAKGAGGKASKAAGEVAKFVQVWDTPVLQRTVEQVIAANAAFDEWRESMKRMVAEGKLGEVAMQFELLGKSVGEAVEETVKLWEELKEETDRKLKEAAELAEERAREMGEALRNALGQGGEVMVAIKAGLEDFAKAEWVKSLAAEIDKYSGLIQEALSQGLDPSAIIAQAKPLFAAYAEAVKGVAETTAQAVSAMSGAVITSATQLFDEFKALTERENAEQLARQQAQIAAIQAANAAAIAGQISAGFAASQSNRQAVNEAIEELSQQASVREAHGLDTADLRRAISFLETRGPTADIIALLGKLGGSPGADTIAAALGGLSGFAHGGVVPGPIGAPVPAIVHGGERITPAGLGGSTLVVQVNLNAPIYGIENLREEIRRVVRDTALGGGFRGVLAPA